MKTLVCLFFMIPVILLGQGVSIDFEDQDLTGWFQSDTGHWCISATDALNGGYSLAHCFDDSTAGKDWIAYFYEPIDTDAAECSWQFMLRYNHDPSSSNRWAVYFTGNTLPDEDGRLNEGLVLGVNYDGNTDELMLWQIEEGIISELFNTGFNWQLNITPGEVVNIRLVRNTDRIASIEIDTAGNGFFTLGSFPMEMITRVNSFILSYNYTATYDQGLFLDNLIINGTFIPDYEPPLIKSIEVLNPTSIEIQFSEPVLPESEAEWCVDDIGCGNTYDWFSEKLKVVLPAPLVPGNIYTLHLPSVADVYGNDIQPDQGTGVFYYPQAFDVLITEIMADPSPTVLLPDAEYIELFNPGTVNISLNNWYLTVNNKQVQLPSVVLNANSYDLICGTEFQAQFDTGTVIIALPDMPAISNSGAELLLQDRSGKLIHAVHYYDDWYADAQKDEGGWSLEMINPNDPCAGKTNWKASVDYTGGTPGKQNSVIDLQQTNAAPELWRAAVTDTGSLMLYFSEPLDSASLSEKEYYTIDHSVGNPIQVKASWPIADKVELYFDEPFESDLKYEISITSDLCDCSGSRLIQTVDALFSIPLLPDSSDIVINEVMFDPEQDLIEFTELYNRSSKTIDLKDCILTIGNRDEEGKVITTEYWPVAPDCFALIAHDYSCIDQPGLFDRAARVVYMPDMPQLPNTGSNLYLSDREGNILDAASYSPDQHHEILADTKGVSLERTSSDRSGMDAGNWHSASSDAGYKTPAAPNSQWLQEDAPAEVTITPKTITPDADGTDDVLSVCYLMDKPGYMARILVFDAEGRQQYALANGALLGIEGCYTFDGSSEDGNLLPTGYYVLYFEAYHAESDRHVFKKAFVVAK